MTDQGTAAQLSPEACTARQVLSEIVAKMDFPATVEAEETPEQITTAIATFIRLPDEMAGGRGSFEMAFARYDVVPSNVAQKVIAEAEKVKEEEKE